jgi:hypothetical protein
MLSDNFIAYMNLSILKSIIRHTRTIISKIVLIDVPNSQRTQPHKAALNRHLR